MKLAPDTKLEKSLIITAPDGAKSELTVYESGNDRAPVFLCVPALGVRARFYEPLARALVSAGFNASCTELRGTGTSSVRPARGVDYGYETVVSLDIPTAIDALKEKFPEAPIYLLGHSMGGQLATLMLAAHPDRADGLALVATSSVYWRSYPFPHNLRTLLGTQFIRIVARIAGYHPGARLGFGGNAARTLMTDWARQALSGRYRPKGAPLDYEQALENMAKPVLAVSLEGDFLAARGAVDHLCGKLRRAAITRLHITLEGPRGPGGPHFDWVKNPAQAVRLISEWVRSLNK
ncbi:MAG: alpha/beta fold hydrolase [Spirochaetes bacterium]|nr:MAG: alpha/beta fold hydrolase [Spirochaetota bacterium]